MDWFSWLSKTTLDPSLVYEYGVVFAHNELEAEDIPFFSHDFLQRMGISVAKHRIEILKLAQRESHAAPSPLSTLIAAIKQTKRHAAKCLQALMGHKESALAIVPKDRNKSSRETKPKKTRKVLLLTDGSCNGRSGLMKVASATTPAHSPLSFSFKGDSCKESTVRSSGKPKEDFQWALMFQDLKPT